MAQEGEARSSVFQRLSTIYKTRKPKKDLPKLSPTSPNLVSFSPTSLSPNSLFTSSSTFTTNAEINQESNINPIRLSKSQSLSDRPKLKRPTCREMQFDESVEESDYVDSSFKESPTPIEKLSRENNDTQTEKIPRESTQAEKITREIIQSEASYIQDLKLVVKCFLNPLRKARILSSQEICDIFLNVEVLVVVSNNLLDMFLKAEQEARSVATVFMKMLAHLEAYTMFCANQAKSMSTLRSCKQKPEVQDFFKALQENPSHPKEDLNSFLIKPIQRICKYPLLVQGLLKHTPTSAAEYKTIKEGWETLLNLVNSIDANKEMSKEREIFNLVDIDNTVLAPSSLFICQASMSYLEHIGREPFNESNSSLKFRAAQFFLFTDFIMWSEPFPSPNEKMKVLGTMIFTSSHTLTFPQEGQRISQTKMLQFEIRNKRSWRNTRGPGDSSSDTVLVFKASSRIVKEIWIAALSSIFSNLRSQRLPWGSRSVSSGRSKKEITALDILPQRARKKDVPTPPITRKINDDSSIKFERERAASVSTVFRRRPVSTCPTVHNNSSGASPPLGPRVPSGVGVGLSSIGVDTSGPSGVGIGAAPSSSSSKIPPKVQIGRTRSPRPSRSPSVDIVEQPQLDLIDSSSSLSLSEFPTLDPFLNSETSASTEDLQLQLSSEGPTVQDSLLLSSEPSDDMLIKLPVRAKSCPAIIVDTSFASPVNSPKDTDYDASGDRQNNNMVANSKRKKKRNRAITALDSEANKDRLSYTLDPITDPTGNPYLDGLLTRLSLLPEKTPAHSAPVTSSPSPSLSDTVISPSSSADGVFCEELHLLTLSKFSDSSFSHTESSFSPPHSPKKATSEKSKDFDQQQDSDPVSLPSAKVRSPKKAGSHIIDRRSKVSPRALAHTQSLSQSQPQSYQSNISQEEKSFKHSWEIKDSNDGEKLIPFPRSTSTTSTTTISTATVSGSLGASSSGSGSGGLHRGPFAKEDIRVPLLLTIPTVPGLGLSSSPVAGVASANSPRRKAPLSSKSNQPSSTAASSSASSSSSRASSPPPSFAIDVNAVWKELLAQRQQYQRLSSLVDKMESRMSRLEADNLALREENLRLAALVSSSSSSWSSVDEKKE